MSTENKWRCPINDFGPENGLATGDVETFKKEPVLSLAREIGQNSIDANAGVLPTYVEYKLFYVDRNRIPGIDELSRHISICYEYKKDLPKEAQPLGRMLEYSKKNQIACLRISDMNTKGLQGVLSNDEDKPFYLLTKGSGVSYKEGTTGGSKGIGKFASFVNSELNTVFYSTYSIDNERGYIGISKLRSAPIPDREDGMKTQGIMYYSSNDRKEPIKNEELILDENFSRKENEFGTDVFIIGFNEEADWKWIIASKVLESFMVAIFRGKLVVKIDDLLVDNSNLENIVCSDKLYDASGKRMYKDIFAQYELLKDENVFVKQFSILDKGEVEIRVKKYSQEHSDQGTQKCVLIRYPYMKIKSETGLANVPFSALCIIEDNKLNELLRNVENPQHTDWEFKRLNDDKELKRETKAAEKALMNTIKEYVKEVLIEGETDFTDVYGAGEYLPATEKGDFGEEIVEKEDIQVVTRPKQNDAAAPRKTKLDEDNEAFVHDLGEAGEEGEEGKENSLGADGESDNPYDDVNDKGDKKVGDGDSPVMKKTRIGGIKYRNIILDRTTGTYDVVFTSPYDENNCELEIRLCGEGSDTYKVDIIDAEINGEPGIIEDGIIKGISIKKDQKYVIRYVTGINKYFSSEVIMNAYR